MTTFSEYEIGKHRLGCPSCGRGGRDRTAGLKIDPDGSGVIHCFRCSYTESRRPEGGANVSRTPTIEPKTQAHQHQRLNDWGTMLWNSTHDLGGIAAQYLRSRRCVVPAYGDLRWLPALKHPSGYVGPALVALITDIHTREPLSLHRTWITESGKADIENPRLLLGNHATVGGVSQQHICAQLVCRFAANICNQPSLCKCPDFSPPIECPGGFQGVVPALY